MWAARSLGGGAGLVGLGQEQAQNLLGLQQQRSRKSKKLGRGADQVGVARPYHQSCTCPWQASSTGSRPLQSMVTTTLLSLEVAWREADEKRP